MFQDKKYIEDILTALAEELKAEGIHHLELLVCGGAALMVLAFERTFNVKKTSYTHDEDDD